jgi:AcrR family transcriptional regulator
MVEQKSGQRGRPRAYDTDAVLDRAAEVFWTNGYSATSLDDLSAAMGMGRPSIYNAFGDKNDLFLRALERYRDTVAGAPLRAFEAADSVSDALDAFFRQTVEYTTADSSHLGCLLVNVAPATDSPEVRRFLRETLAGAEELIGHRLTSAADSGELPSGYSAREGARRAVNLMLSLGARARMGTPRADLLRDAATATAIVIGAGPDR